jgi:glycosyltransferase involved in cell wall biosynthesis
MREPGPDPIRVVMVAPPFYEIPPARYGGIERVCFTLVEGLVDRGHDVTLVGAGRRHTRADYVATLPVAPSEQVDDPVAVEVRHSLVASRIIREIRPDIVHDHTRGGLLSAADHPCPSVATVHAALAGPESHEDIYRSVGSAIDLVAVSDSQRADAPDLNWVARVYNGISLPNQNGVERTAHHALYLGRLSTTKGVDLAVAAARAAGRPLVLAGGCTTSTESDYLSRTIAPLLGDGIEWVGDVDDEHKQQLLAAAGCLILPLRWHEPFGLVVAEAMAAGVPVVALRLGALPELVRQGVTGVLCDTDDELPAAINRAFELDGAACRDWAARHFDGRRMVAEYEQVYRRSIAKPDEHRRKGPKIRLGSEGEPEG